MYPGDRFVVVRRFCRIGLEARVPDESTIRKLTRRLGPGVVDQLNRLLLDVAAETGQLRLDKVRVDTTVVEADIKYPTDSGLLTKAISRTAVLMRRIETTGMRIDFVDRTLEARHNAHSIGVWLRRRSDEAKAEVLTITGLLADLAETSLAEADQVLRSKRRPRRAARRRIAELAVLVERTRRLIVQARTRIDGEVPPGATRLVSLHEPDARPIAKGRLGKPVEFGYKAQVCDNVDGLIVDHSVHMGNPHDTDLLLPAIARIVDHCGAPPGMLTADRGYWNSTMESDLRAAGVVTVAIPRTGKPSAARVAIERADIFVAAVKWRTGSEGRISHLKRDLGWRRTRLRNHEAPGSGAATASSHTTSPSSTSSDNDPTDKPPAQTDQTPEYFSAHTNQPRRTISSEQPRPDQPHQNARRPEPLRNTAPTRFPGGSN